MCQRTALMLLFVQIDRHRAEKQSMSKIDRDISEADNADNPQHESKVVAETERQIINIFHRLQESMKQYELTLQSYQEKLRKHAKIEIQLRLYYEHLQEVIDDYKAQVRLLDIKVQQLQDDLQAMENIRQGQIDSLKSRKQLSQKESIKCTSNTKEPIKMHTENIHTQRMQTESITTDRMGENQPKEDTISKIKNKLLFMDVGEFGNYGTERQFLSQVASKRSSITKEAHGTHRMRSKKKSKDGSRTNCRTNLYNNVTVPEISLKRVLTTEKVYKKSSSSMKSIKDKEIFDVARHERTEEKSKNKLNVNRQKNKH